MCQICGAMPCHHRCPNASEPPVFSKCVICKEEIYDGDEYFEYDGDDYHDECFRDNAVELLLQNGATKGIAEVE